jgi:hypothetical protein
MDQAESFSLAKTLFPINNLLYNQTQYFDYHLQKVIHFEVRMNTGGNLNALNIFHWFKDQQKFQCLTPVIARDSP